MVSVIAVLAVIFFLVFLANMLNDRAKDSAGHRCDVPGNEVYDIQNHVSVNIKKMKNEDIKHEEPEAKHDELNREEARHETPKQEQLNEDENPYAPATMIRMYDVLVKLGCQPVKNDDGSIFVSYQGENFHMDFAGNYVNVWDPLWAGIKIDDPNLPTIREAVNAVNFKFGPTVVMTAPNDEGIIGLHSRREVMLHQACPDNVPYVKAVLDSFFDVKDEVHRYYWIVDEKLKEAKNNHRPIGFATDFQE